MWEVQKSKGRLIDYGKLAIYIKKRFDSLRAKVFYYTAYPEAGTRVYDLAPKHRFFAYLRKSLKFQIRKKPLKTIRVIVENQQSVVEKGNMDVELTIDAAHHSSNYDVAVLLTGDSDFHALVQYLRNKGKKVYIMSSKGSISKELRTAGNGYMDMRKIYGIWGNKLKNRNK